ncbi:MAG: response regulator [Burkholderiaceae bacterium]|jgi:DNA-binding response OmpR family regulator|nr:response regulator [Burkholderiaceae bacterium]MEB2318450.1 response regulator [Pseudomonadota bacterium]
MATGVLIVEDEPNIVESLSFVLQRAGHAVTSALDGEAALGILRSSAPDLLILDLMLPGINGFEVLKTVKSDPALKQVPVIVLTAKGQARDRRMAEDIGVEGFMTKPFSNRELVELVDKLVKR